MRPEVMIRPSDCPEADAILHKIDDIENQRLARLLVPCVLPFREFSPAGEIWKPRGLACEFVAGMLKEADDILPVS
jgi:hypothetical protein